METLQYIIRRKLIELSSGVLLTVKGWNNSRQQNQYDTKKDIHFRRASYRMLINLKWQRKP